jgi:hypothetical protein
MLILSLSAIKNTCSKGLMNDEKVKRILKLEFYLSLDEATNLEIILTQAFSHPYLCNFK